MLMKFFSLNQRSLFSIHDPEGVKILTRLRLQFSHFNEHKFCHNLKDCVSRMCDCGAETVTFSYVANFLQMKDKSSIMMFIG